MKLIPPYDQVVLDNAFTKIDQWSITLLRDAVLEAGDTYKKSQFNLRRCTSDMSLGVLPCARFMLAALGMLTVEHAAAGVSLLLNSGVLALTQVSKVLLLTASPKLNQCRRPPFCPSSFSSLAKCPPSIPSCLNIHTKVGF